MIRLLIIGGQLVAAARREPPYVIGNNKNTVRELVEEVNKDPLRGDGHATSLSKIRIDEIAIATLKNQNLTPDSVPPKGLRVTLRNNANLSTGGTATDVTDDVHPDLAVKALQWHWNWFKRKFSQEPSDENCFDLGRLAWHWL